MPSHHLTMLDATGCDALADRLGDTPETTIPAHMLRRRLCSAHVTSEPDGQEAVVLRSKLLPEEPLATTAQTERHADVGVVTMEEWRGQGMATACAALVAEGIHQSGRVPVWSTGEDNLASLRVASKLGFGEVGRRVYLVPSRNTVG